MARPLKKYLFAASHSAAKNHLDSALYAKHIVALVLVLQAGQQLRFIRGGAVEQPNSGERKRTFFYLVAPFSTGREPGRQPLPRLRDSDIY